MRPVNVVMVAFASEEKAKEFFTIIESLLDYKMGTKTILRPWDALDKMPDPSEMFIVDSKSY